MGCVTSFAQTVVLELKFQGRVRVQADNGQFVSRPLNERDIIRHCAEIANAGTTNLNRFMLVYEVGGDFNGDVIRVVNKSDGTVICSPFRVLFQESITNGEGRRDERMGFLYNGWNTDTKGSVILVRKPRVKPDGSRGREMLQGDFQMVDEIYQPDRKGILTGTFQTGRELTW